MVVWGGCSEWLPIPPNIRHRGKINDFLQKVGQFLTQWSVQVSDETGKALRAFLAQRDGESDNLSAFVERAVRTVIRRETIKRMQDRNGQYDQQEILDAVDDAVKWARGHRP